MVTPRFNFAQLFGVLWLAPLLLILAIIFLESSRSSDPFHTDSLIAMLGAFFLLLISANFLFKKKWVRYLVGIGLFLSTLLIGFILFDTFSTFNRGNSEFFFGQFFISLSGFTLIFGFFLLIFNIGIAIEFERERKEPIDYTKALHDTQLNQHYFFRNTMDLTVPIALILIAPSFIFLFVLFDEISRNLFNLDSKEDIFLVLIAASSLICGIGAFLKLKIIRHITLITFVLIGLFALSEIRGSISYKDLFIMSTLAITGITFCASFLAMLFHPIMTHSFENTVESIEDYDDILDISLVCP